jgi:hypothetical protein
MLITLTVFVYRCRYDMCGNDDAEKFATVGTPRSDGAVGIYASLNDQTHEQHQRLRDHANGQGGLNNYPCGESVGMNAWLNVKAVQEALHVTVAHRPDGKWAPSSGLNYTHTEPTLLHMYVAHVMRAC